MHDREKDGMTLDEYHNSEDKEETRSARFLQINEVIQAAKFLFLFSFLLTRDDPTASVEFIIFHFQRKSSFLFSSVVTNVVKRFKRMKRSLFSNNTPIISRAFVVNIVIKSYHINRSISMKNCYLT